MTQEEKHEELKTMSLGDHLEELRIRLILSIAGIFAGMVVCLFFGRFFINILIMPFADAVNDPNAVNYLQTIAPAEGFATYIKVSLFFGLILSSPWVFWQAWAFISAGLYSHEKRFVHTVAPICAALFIAGSVFFILYIAPITMKFFILFNQKMGLASNWRFRDYMNMVLRLMLVFGAAFQLPVAMVFANKMGLVSVAKLTAGRKYVLLAIFVVAAIATPPDVVSQIGLALPLYALYEGGIIACRVLSKKKAQTEPA